MKIWLDLRFINDDLYSAFTLELVETIITLDQDNTYTIYTNKFLEWYESINSKIKNINIKNGSFKEQTTYLNILKKDKQNIMIFFNHYKPVFYVWNYITVLPGLKDIYYSNFSNYFKKYSYIYLLEKNLKKSKFIIYFDNNTKEELIEKYNIEEKRTKFLPWFFPYAEKLNNTENLNLNIRAKYNIKNKYLIYSWWEWVEKNYDKLVKAFKKLKDEWTEIDLVFLWETISRNIPLRNFILNLEMQNNIHFIWVIKPAEKILFYKNSIWNIFPSLYEPFPFRLTEPLYFDTPIIASDLKNIKNIFNDQINYFSPISVNSMYEEIKKFIWEKNKVIDYSNIKEKYLVKNTATSLLEIIK